MDGDRPEGETKNVSLSEGADLLSTTVVQVSFECAREIGTYRVEYEGKRDFDDAKFISTAVLFQWLFLHLARRAGKEILGDFKDSMFFGALYDFTVAKCEKTAPHYTGEIDAGQLREIYRTQYHLYDARFRQYKLPRESGRELAGTLYWEFARHLSDFVDGTPDNTRYLTLAAELVKASLTNLNMKRLLKRIR